MELNFGMHNGKELSSVPYAYLCWVVENVHNLTWKMEREIIREIANRRKVEV